MRLVIGGAADGTKAALFVLVEEDCSALHCLVHHIIVLEWKFRVSCAQYFRNSTIIAISYTISVITVYVIGTQAFPVQLFRTRERGRPGSEAMLLCICWPSHLNLGNRKPFVVVVSTQIVQFL